MRLEMTFGHTALGASALDKKCSQRGIAARKERKMKTAIISIAAFLSAAVLFQPATTSAKGYNSPTAPGTGITATAHDFTLNLGTSADLCSCCHSPHIDDESLTPPLWNQKVSATAFDVYTQEADDHPHQTDDSAAEALMYRPGPSSMICLSCHDGINASNQYGFLRRTVQGANSEGDYDTGHASLLHLKDHPIGFDYRKREGTIGISSVTEQVTESFTISDLLREGKMECVTCHDVHNLRNQGEKFLWTSDSRSNFCLTCHIK